MIKVSYQKRFGQLFAALAVLAWGATGFASYSQAQGPDHMNYMDHPAGTVGATVGAAAATESADMMPACEHLGKTSPAENGDCSKTGNCFASCQGSFFSALISPPEEGFAKAMRLKTPLVVLTASGRTPPPGFRPPIHIFL